MEENNRRGSSNARLYRGQLFILVINSFTMQRIPTIHIILSRVEVLALRGSYHGDTLGAMEAQAPSSYTGFLQQPW
ncbi:hypothetical protein RJ640_015189 [Escallonia rubra]|uniref:Uncharacterized protein n=1 Tax=Escallonia rubra TaxID=112253 RepID=A0AA88SL33_9ASTE|nr:hypothetical protein RJ640_015189 [Escallonia rubra]